MRAGLLLQAVVNFGEHVSDGRIIESIAPAWLEIARLMERDPTILHKIDSRKWEEIIAGSYKKAGFEEVTLTPSSGDIGAMSSRSSAGFARSASSTKSKPTSQTIS